MSDVVFLLWSGKHEAWWRHRGFGYTADIDQAGRFTESQAIKHVVKSAMCGDRTQVTLMVAAPDNWLDVPPPALRIVAGPGPLRDVLPEALERLTGGWPSRDR